MLRPARTQYPAMLQDHRARVVEDGAADPLEAHLRRGRLRAGAGRDARQCTSDVLRGRVFVALHMHAGDGNVHTNIPVNSDNYAMLHDGQRRPSPASCSSPTTSAA